MKTLDILPLVLDKKYWEDNRSATHLTGHTHYRSPYESDDNCGTCDGAKCDTCREVHDGFEFVYTMDDIREFCKALGVSEELAYGLYNFGKTRVYEMPIPTEYNLAQRCPEFLEELRNQPMIGGRNYE